MLQSAEWRRLHRACIELHELQWIIDAYDAGSDAAAWVQDTQVLLRATRSAIRKEKQRMLRDRRPPMDANPAAQIHRMLASDALPSELLSVLDNRGELTRSPAELASVMRDHFRSVFTAPPPSGVPLPHPVPAMLLDKSSVRGEWYDGLMRDVTAEELLDVTRSVPLISAPGEDEVSSGLWKTALHGSPVLCSLVVALFSACLRASHFSFAWKHSIIVPLFKDASKERNMSNVRPISLQSCLGKLLNKLLAHRLSHIFATHPILHPAQRGFIHGGSITKCIDELLDVWRWSREGRGHELYTLFYDIKQAYDSVQVKVLTRAMRRLRMPQCFVDLVVNSLTGLTSCVRTAYGLSDSLEVQRSLRQGDPLAPLLFVILMDALHDGLECNPFSGERHGLVMEMRHGVVHSIPSEGYADDTNLHANTLHSMRVQNDWVHYFLAFNELHLNHSKCELVGRDAEGQPVTAAALAAAGITIEGHPLVPIPHHQSIRYLGVHVRFDGSWDSQCSQTSQLIARFTRVVSRFSVQPRQAVYMYNVFLMPKLELALHYGSGPRVVQWIKQCDRMLVSSIAHAASASIHVSHSAVALTLGLLLPSWLEAASKVSELFLRINSSDGRWGALGRTLLHHAFGGTIDASTAGLQHGTTQCPMGRAAHLAAHKLGWSLHLNAHEHDAGRRLHLFKQPLVTTIPPEQCSCYSRLQLPAPAGVSYIAHDLWRGWGAAVPASFVAVYTDGSYGANSQPHSTSSWALTVADESLTRRYHSVPSHENLVQQQHVRGMAVYGAAIHCTRGIYPAELQAIARALAMFPASFSLRIHSDSQASIAAVRTYEQLSSERERLRMAARPLLQLISNLLRLRRAAGGEVQLSHVKAHSTDSDIHSVGNRLSDFHANRARLHAERSQPLSLQELPLHECERHMHIMMPAPAASDGGAAPLQLIDDVRRAALARCKSLALTHWHSRAVVDVDDGQGVLAGAGMMHLGRVVMRHGSAEQQCALVLVATNSTHFYWLPAARPAAAGQPRASVQRLACSHCLVPLTLTHLATCSASSACVQFQRSLKASVLQLVAPPDAASLITQAWRRSHAHLELLAMLRQLFSMPPPPLPCGSDQLNAAAAICGAFTFSQSNAAAKSLGCVDLLAGRSLMQLLRLLCLDHVARFYSDHKAAACSAAAPVP